jgi:uncharacterized membrane protein HdeD (DUF308 family)
MRNANFFDAARGRMRAGLAELDEKWGWYFGLGGLLIVLGAIASTLAVATTLLSVITLGSILVVAGAALIVHSFFTGKWSGFLLSLAAGALTIGAGITFISSPLSGAVGLTLMVGALLVASGIFRASASVVMQFPNWGWSLVSGLVSLFLGSMLLREWQTAGLYFLGFYIGIDLIMHGISWIMFSLKIHSLAGEYGISESDRRAA